MWRSPSWRKPTRSRDRPCPPPPTAQLADLFRQWLGAPAGPTPDAAAEARRFGQAASFSRSNSVRAVAFNQLGVAFELEDALGPSVRAYGRAVYLDPGVPLYRFNLGLALRKIGSFERALEEFAAAARLEPGSVPARKRVAEVTSLLGRHEEALVLTEALLGSAPQDHSLWELKAQLLLKLRRPAEAIAPARLAAELDPDCPVAHSYLAETLHAAGKLDEALAAWTEALDRAPFEAVFVVNLGTLQRDLGLSAAAEHSFRRALELRPDFALAHYNLGNALADRRDLAGAAAAFQKARELDPADAAAHWRFADMALKQRQFDGAERAYRDALELAPGSAEAWYGSGEAHRLQRRSADAEAAYRKAIELRPDYAAAHTALGIVFYDRGDVDEAERLYRRAIELDPAEAAPYHNLGNLCREARGDLDAAERWFRQALERAPDDGESLGGLGLVASNRGNLAEAERLLRQAVEWNPGSSALHNNLGEVVRERGRLEEAELLYRKALELNPDNPAPYGNLGIVYAERRQFAEAEQTFRALLERSTGNARLPALVNLAMVCGEQGKLDEAERLYRQALELAFGHPRVANGLAAFLAEHERKLDEALALAEGAVRAQPDNPSFLDTLGWVQAQHGDLDAAERTLQRALRQAGQEPPADEIRKHLQDVQEKKTSGP
ncbi:MAG: tetratricopeptide repeat protein [Verrucomicrobia bacterium]|nr:tetratricopeptide repeat protein [Verrucomicrobiota bacterium]